MKRSATAPRLLLTACILATTATSALAAQERAAAPPALSAASAGGTPANYSVQTSRAIDASNGRGTHGTVRCPAGTVVLGGGAVVAVPSVSVTLHSSHPIKDGSGWVAVVDNSSGADASFTVQAVCATAPAQYAVMETSKRTAHAGATSAPGAQLCPGLERPFGGGVVQSSTSTAVSIDDSYVQVEIDGWFVHVNNHSSADETFRVFAICGMAPTTYHLLTGPLVPLPAGMQQQATVTCPSGDRPLGGGSFSGFVSPVGVLGSSGPTADGWSVAESNPSPGASVEAFVTCA
jgi:hypothetical protein